MPIKFNCPECSTPLEAADGMAGKKGSCPRCKKAVSVPEPPSATSAN